uniref:Uncharacterized protein n=1 Tax=Glossina brevipalpis TaxID=37001 RepID=A0A1A9WQ65_9MUSC
MEKKSKTKSKSKSHATTHRNVFCAGCSVAMQVFLILTLFVIGNLSAWQENVRPKLYVELAFPAVNKLLRNSNYKCLLNLHNRTRNSTKDFCNTWACGQEAPP